MKLADRLLLENDGVPPPPKTSQITEKVIVDGAAGVYVPFIFASNFSPTKWGIDAKDIKTLLEGPDHDDYWDTWDRVLNNASFTDNEGMKWNLYHDGDLFAVREDHEIES